MIIDLRSDTVTQPTKQMREAMYQAEVGDDVYGEDPTINHLQELAAHLMGKEAALFVPSGTMGNAIAMLTHVSRGQSIIVGDQSHIYHYEAGGASTLGNSPMRPIATDENGMFDIQSLEENILDESDPHEASTALICLENTHNRLGGTVLRKEQIETITTLAHKHDLPVHLDGARLFNAAVALQTPVETLVKSIDSIMFCLSKGLSAPVGSILVGDKEFIRKALRARKLLGGGLRQAGFLAAAGIVALETMIDRLAEDHENCQRLAQGLAEHDQIDIEPERIVTNILFFKLRNGEQYLSREETQHFLKIAHQQGVLLSEMGAGRIRAVTHYGIEAQHIDEALMRIKRSLQEMKH